MPLIETAERLLFEALVRSREGTSAHLRLTGRERQQADPAGIYGYAMVDCLATGRQQAYPLDETADWLMAFRQDLLDGSFETTPSD